MTYAKIITMTKVGTSNVSYVLEEIIWLSPTFSAGSLFSLGQLT
jgi:hypothetical protein